MSNPSAQDNHANQASDTHTSEVKTDHLGGGSQATDMQSQNNQIYQQNLDRLHVQWVLGKNRGVDQPLIKEQ